MEGSIIMGSGCFFSVWRAEVGEVEFIGVARVVRLTEGAKDPNCIFKSEQRGVKLAGKVTAEVSPLSEECEAAAWPPAGTTGMKGAGRTPGL